MSMFTGIPLNAAGSGTNAGPTIRAGGIDRKLWDRRDRRRYIREYLDSLKPVIVLGAIDHWPARVKWTPMTRLTTEVLRFTPPSPFARFTRLRATTGPPHVGLGG